MLSVKVFDGNIALLYIEKMVTVMAKCPVLSTKTTIRGEAIAPSVANYSL